MRRVRCRALTYVAGALGWLALLAPSTAGASGQTYTVIECHRLNRDHANAILEDASPYVSRSFCGDPRNGYAIKISNAGPAPRGSFGRARWTTGSSDLGIVAVDVRAKLRRDGGHAPRLWMADPQLNKAAGVAKGGSGPTAYRRYRWNTSAHGLPQFIASLSCQRTGGCRRSGLARTWVRDVRLEVADYSDPSLSNISGTLLTGTWLRGPRSIHAEAGDRGSGIETLAVSINGVSVAEQAGTCDRIVGTTYAARFAVCDGDLSLSETSATGETPFHDGQNLIAVCARDFAGNRTCEKRTVRVDSRAPEIAFTTSQDRDDPELIRARVSDATSGVNAGRILYRAIGDDSWRPLDTHLRSGELRARVDSTRDPPGRYEFRAKASDEAGNVGQTTLRTDGQPMALTFPLKSAVELTAYLVPGGASPLTVGYGHRAKVAGWLQDASGRPLANQRVAVTEYFDAGSLIDRRAQTVRTDADGRWGTRLPAGPSRAVTATYEGSRRYLPDVQGAGRLRVKTRVTFHLSRTRVREGHRVVFHGRVAHLDARIPAGGKLIEVQVKDGSHWNNVRQALYTRRDGHYRMHYRFGRFYTSRVVYRFRVKVLREFGWPYKAPVATRPKRLVVKAR